MIERFSKIKSETDWEYLENMTDDDIDYTDIPPLPDEFYQKATLRIAKRDSHQSERYTDKKRVT